MLDKGQLANLMKKAQEMQTNLQKAQDEVAKIEVEGESGAGLVKVAMNGKHDILKITIDSSIIDKEEKEMLEDLIAAAVNKAVQKVSEKSAEKMGGVAAGMPNLAGLKLPF